MLVIGAAASMPWARTQSDFSRALANALAHALGGSYGFLIGSIAMFIASGSVLEGIPAMALFGPLLFPVARQLGIPRVHWAMGVILATGKGLFAPPFGLGNYATCSIGHVDPKTGLKRICSYLAALATPPVAKVSRGYSQTALAVGCLHTARCQRSVNTCFKAAAFVSEIRKRNLNSFLPLQSFRAIACQSDIVGSGHGVTP